MSDLISRKAVMEELLAIQDVTYMSTCLTVDECKGKRWMIARAIDAVKDAPTIDAVAVVRCEGCRHCDPENKHCDHSMGTTMPFPRRDDDFCSYGERKEATE